MKTQVKWSHGPVVTRIDRQIDGQWSLLVECQGTGQVTMLKTFPRFIFALETAHALQLNVSNLNEHGIPDDATNEGE